MAAAAKRTAAGPTNPRAKGLQRLVVRLEPAQVQALKAEALKRAQAIGSMKPDASELVREAVAAWLKRR